MGIGKTRGGGVEGSRGDVGMIRINQLATLLDSAISGFASGINDPSGVAQVRMNNVEIDGSWNWSNIRRVPSQTAKERYYLRTGDVLFNATKTAQI